MSLDILRQIAGGGKNTPVQPDDIYGQSFIDRSEAFLNSNNISDKSLKWREWRRTVSDWDFTPNNTKYYWDTYLKLSPAGEQATQQSELIRNREVLASFASDSERENYIRDNISKWPDWQIQDIEGWFFDRQDIGASKDLERSRILHREEAYNLMQSLQGDLAPGISVETHGEDWLKAYNHGYGDEIKLENGRVTVPINGERVPAFSLPDPNVTITESFITKNDLRNIVRTRIDDLSYATRQSSYESERGATAALFRKIGTPSIPSEFSTNIILDYTEENDYNIDDVFDGLDRIMLQKFNEDSFHGPGEASRFFSNMFQEIGDKFERRASR